MKEDMSLSNLGTVALHATKVPTNVFSSPLICILTLDYTFYAKLVTPVSNQGRFLNLKYSYSNCYSRDTLE